MNLNALVASLSEQEKQELLNILSANNEDVITLPCNTTPPPEIFKDPNDFTMHSKNSVPQKNRRKVPVKAQQNTWTDTGEHRDISTPEFTKTPRNRKPPKKKTVTCSACGSKSKVNANLIQGQYYRCEKCVG